MQNVVFGLITGSILAIAAAGFAMIRQTEGFLHVAHGQYLALGAYLGFVLSQTLGLNILLSGAIVFVATGAIGVVLARLVFEPVKAKGSIVLLFTSIGLAYVVYSVIIVIFGVELKVYDVSFGRRFDFWGISITVGELTIIGLALLVVLALNLFMTRTPLGTWVRAVASNPELARARGVRVGLVSTTVWFIASGLAGIAGVLIGVVASITAEVGWANILLILAASVMGGLGRVYGVIAAALVLGVAMDVSTLWIPTDYRTVVAFGALIAVLLLRPEGIFAVERRGEQAL